MAGRFEGLNDPEWKLLEPLIEKQGKRGRGMPRVEARRSLNTILYILFTGSRWCDLPSGPQWAHRSSAHRALQRWSSEGKFFAIMQKLLSIAELSNLIDWSAGAVDGSFSPRKRWR